MTRVADTSALYAFLTPDDAHHADAFKAVGEPTPIVIPTEILVETVDLVGLRKGREAARFAFDDLLGLPHVRVAEKVAIEAVREVHAGARGRLSLADAFVVQTCRALGAKPLTFDREIAKAVG